MEDPMMGMSQDPMMGNQGMDGGFDQMNPEMGGDPNAFDGGETEEFNQFDSNFDAGVEADEETDPKRYIQQLTGKLSQSLNKFNDEQGNDEGLSKYVGKIMLEQKKGKIINISSTNAIDTYYPESCDYDASKAGVISLTKNLAVQYAPYVRVNSIAPGWTMTEMNSNLDEEFILKLKTVSEKIFNKSNLIMKRRKEDESNY